MDRNPPMRLPATPQASIQLSPSAILPKRVVKTSRIASRNAAKGRDIPTGFLDRRLQLVIRDHDCSVLPIPLSEVRGVGALFSSVFDWRAVDLHFFVVVLSAEDGPGACFDANEGHGVIGAFDMEVAEEDCVAFFEGGEGFYVGAG